MLFASEPKAILAHPSVPAVVDLDGMRELLAFVKTPGHGVYQGINELRPGHTIVVDRSGLHQHRYWGLRAVEHHDDTPTTVRRVRELLEDIVSRQLIADVPLCALLSGGLDSSAITALAATALRGAGTGPVHSFAVDFTGQTERFQPDAMRDTPDAPFVHEVAAHVGAEHADIVLDTQALTDPLYRKTALRASDSPIGSSEMYTSLYLLFRAVREHSTVALSGESADEVFGGYRWFHDERAVNAGTFPWLAWARTIEGQRGDGVAGLLDPDLVAALDLGGYRRDSYRQALAEVEHLPGEDPKEHRMREVCHLHLTRFVQILLDRKDRMSMANGLEVRVPFCDHRLVEYVYNTPWSMKTFDGREKSLLRAAVADILPESVLQRRKSPYPSTQDPAYGQALTGRLAEVLADPHSPVLDLLDRHKADELAKSPASDGDSRSHRMTTELLLSLDQWLRNHTVSLDLST